MNWHRKLPPIFCARKAWFPCHYLEERNKFSVVVHISINYTRINTMCKSTFIPAI